MLSNGFTSMKTTFHFRDIELAFSGGHITLEQFAEVLRDNYGEKKARKILRRNLETALKQEGMPWPERQEHLELIQFLFKQTSYSTS
jgi:hypothetical protein